MFPDSDDSPTGLPEKATGTQVATPVCRELFRPPRSVTFRRCSVSRTPMPETTINKDRDSCGQKENINPGTNARNYAFVSRVSQTEFGKCLAQPKFCFCSTLSGSLHPPAHRVR